MQQLLKTVSILPCLEKMELRFQSTKMLDQIAAFISYLTVELSGVRADI